MRYFFLAYALIIVLVISFFGFRGQKFSSTPIRIFPDMDEQDKLKTQKPSDFFVNGMGSRKPVAGTVPRGFDPEGTMWSFGNSSSYSHTGLIDGAYGTGIPEDIELAKNPEAFLRRGKERYMISCMPCHGESGAGGGIVAEIGISMTPSLLLFPRENYPDGMMFETITKGKRNMSGYGYNIPVDDRWAIIAYVRAIQEAPEKPAE